MPNVLPCGIKHDGQVDTSKRYWAPQKGEGMLSHTGHFSRTDTNVITDGKDIAYFRGRKLQGREVKLPEGYAGVVLAPKATKDEKMYNNDSDEDRIEEAISEELAHFDDLMVWDHGALPDESSDPYLRGVEEWISFAETVGRA